MATIQNTGGYNYQRASDPTYLKRDYNRASSQQMHMRGSPSVGISKGSPSVGISNKAAMTNQSTSRHVNNSN